MKVRKYLSLFLIVLASAGILAALEHLLVPKYTGQVVEGAFIEEYYEEETSHDVIILGDCQVYENISPVTLWREYGITSYIRGSAQQLLPQSYYLLEDTLDREMPKAVLFSVSAMGQYEQDNESYNRMTLDGMRWSKSKVDAIRATMMDDEHMVEYLFPILRFHSRWRELKEDDFKYYFSKPKVSHNGYYMRADVRPAGEFPAMRRRSDYSFDDRAWEYLEKMRVLCEQNGITLILMKSPALYPAWYDQWEVQIEEYAREHNLAYLNFLEDSDQIGIDFSTDTYDGGLHMNVYGAEKLSSYLGEFLMGVDGIEDHRTKDGNLGELDKVWEEKCRYYDKMKAEQKAEFEELGYLKQFAAE